MRKKKNKKIDAAMQRGVAWSGWWAKGSDREDGRLLVLARWLGGVGVVS